MKKHFWRFLQQDTGNGEIILIFSRSADSIAYENYVRLSVI